MEFISLLPLILYAGFFLVSGAIIIYLIIKRLQNDGNEDFEKRDN